MLSHSASCTCDDCFTEYLLEKSNTEGSLDQNNLGLNMKDPLKNRKENDLIRKDLLSDFEDEEEVKDE